MPKDLVDDKGKVPLAVRVPVDGDDASGANFELPYQQLTNRTAYLLDQCETQGVRRIRRAAILDCLRFEPSPEPTELRWVDGRGLYAYDPGLAGPDELPWKVMSTVAPGGWLNMLVSLRSTSAKNAYTLPIPIATSSGAWDDALSVTLPDAEPGHRLMVAFHGRLAALGATATFQLSVVEATGVDLPLEETTDTVTAATVQLRAWTTQHVVSALGPVTVKLRMRAGPGGTASLRSNSCLSAHLVRF